MNKIGDWHIAGCEKGYCVMERVSDCQSRSIMETASEEEAKYFIPKFRQRSHKFGGVTDTVFVFSQHLCTIPVWSIVERIMPFALR